MTSPSGLRRKGGRVVMEGAVHPLVYGPVDSRRYGRSLGLNPLPSDLKFCNWDCGYCQLGFTDREAMRGQALPARREIREALEGRLGEMRAAGEGLDHITIAGNGEPTLHPEFPGIVDDVLALRDRLFPEVRVGVLSNGSTAHVARVREALNRLDVRVMKLDGGTDAAIEAVDRPVFGWDRERTLRALEEMEGVTVQALFHRGPVDNTGEDEIEAWLGVLERIRPREVQVYSLDRRPADSRLEPCPRERLEEIAARVRERLGVPCAVH